MLRPRSGVALLALLLLSFHTGCQEQSSSTAPRRFEVHAVQTAEGPVLVRFDTATGELTQSPLTGGREWLPLGSLPGVGPERRAGRYALDYVQAPSIPLTFIRVDTDTGTVWRMRHPGDRDWTALRGSSSSLGQAEKPPAPRPERDRRPAAAAPQPAVPAIADPTPTADEVGTLIEAASSADLPAEMRGWAVEQLGNSPGEQAAGALVELLGDEDPLVVRAAVRALAKHDDPRVRPALEQLKQHDTPEVRRVAESVLSGLR
jgi:hypothetical protein